ncbi:MAG: indole-3-glycerol phosphate synthase TrpC [Thermomicrobiales bacterium]
MTTAIPQQTGTYLDRILAQTAKDVETRKALISRDALHVKAAEQPVPIDVEVALNRDCVTVIAEIKRASPSKGIFPVSVVPSEIATAYIEGGAAAISCLTDEPFFKGSLADLETVTRTAYAARNPIGVLRKDFMLDRYQIDEARAFGASCILLIVAALDDATLADLHAYARSIGLSVLVEVHDEEEAGRAVAAGSTLIGINNRDLRSFHVDLAATERIAPTLPAGTTIVGESGIFTTDDVARLADAGVAAVLVGESLIMHDDRAAATRALAGVPRVH